MMGFLGDHPMGVTFIHSLCNGPAQLQKNLSRLLVALAAATLLGACNGGRAEEALHVLNLENSPSSRLAWQKQDVSGGKVVFHDAVLQYISSKISVKTLAIDGLTLDPQGRPTLKSITLSGISGDLGAPGLALAAKRLSAKGLSTETGAWAAAFLAQPPDAEIGPVPALQTLGFDEIRLSGLVVSNDPKAPAASPAYATLAVDDLTVSSLATSIIRSVALSDLSFSFSAPRSARRDFVVQGGFDLGGVKLEGLRADRLIARLTHQPPPAASPIDPGIDALTMKDFRADASGARLTVPSVDLDVKRDVSGLVTETQLAPTSATLSVNPLTGRFGQLGGAIFSTLGYERIEAKANARLAYDPSADTARGEGGLSLVNGFDLALDAALSGFRMEEDSAQPSLSSFNASLTDRSLTDRLLALGPLTSGASPTALREDVATMVEALGKDAATGGVDPAVASEISKALAAFIRKPGNLVVSVKPTAPWSPAADPGFRTPKAKLGFSAAYMPPVPQPAP